MNLSPDRIRLFMDLVEFYSEDTKPVITEAVVQTKTAVPLKETVINELTNLATDLRSKICLEGSDDYKNGYEAALYEIAEQVEQLIQMKLKDNLNG